MAQIATCGCGGVALLNATLNRLQGQPSCTHSALAPLPTSFLQIFVDFEQSFASFSTCQLKHRISLTVNLSSTDAHMPRRLVHPLSPMARLHRSCMQSVYFRSGLLLSFIPSPVSSCRPKSRHQSPSRGHPTGRDPSRRRREPLIMMSPSSRARVAHVDLHVVLLVQHSHIDPTA